MPSNRDIKFQQNLAKEILRAEVDQALQMPLACFADPWSIGRKSGQVISPDYLEKHSQILRRSPIRFSERTFDESWTVEFKY
jgi:hypothetical protein